jgi:hypothetical protein
VGSLWVSGFAPLIGFVVVATRFPTVSHVRVLPCRVTEHANPQQLKVFCN